MAAMYERDLENATEIVLDAGRMRAAKTVRQTGSIRHRKRYANRNRLVAGTVGLGSTVGAALTRHRPLGVAESGVLFAGGTAVTLISLVALLTPRLLAYPLGIIGIWMGASLLARAWRTRRSRQTESVAKP